MKPSRAYTIKVKQVTEEGLELLNSIKTYGLGNINFYSKNEIDGAILHLEKDGVFVNETLVDYYQNGSLGDTVKLTNNSTIVEFNDDFKYLCTRKVSLGDTVHRAVLGVIGDKLYLDGYSSYHRTYVDLKEEVGHTGTSYRDYFKEELDR